MPEPIISVSGLRGIVGVSLTPDLAIRYVTAFAALAPAGPLVVTRDGRTTGPMLADAIRAGLQAVGRTVIDADVAATPTTGVLVRANRAGGGIQISASHNPPEYNGIKLFSADGRVIPADAGQLVIDRFRQSTPVWVGHDRLGHVETCGDTIAEHLRLVLATVDVARIRRRRFRVLLDANHGAGSVLGRRLLDELGCETVVLGSDPDGRFEHPPEPTAENLAGVRRSVVEARGDVGFCQDPDADRLALIDEAGRYIGEEYTPALCADHILRRRVGPVVTNCSTSRMIQDLAERSGAPFQRSAVGEANVVDCMLRHGAIYGAEGNGGVIDPRVGLVRDSFAGMALVLDGLAERGGPLSAWADALPRYEIVKTKAPLSAEKLPAAFTALERRFADATVDRLDGLRLDWPGKWLLVRGSNTEPIVRAIAEAGTAAEAQRLCDDALAVMAGHG